MGAAAPCPSEAFTTSHLTPPLSRMELLDLMLSLAKEVLFSLRIKMGTESLKCETYSC